MSHESFDSPLGPSPHSRPKTALFWLFGLAIAAVLLLGLGCVLAGLWFAVRLAGPAVPPPARLSSPDQYRDVAAVYNFPSPGSLRGDRKDLTRLFDDVIAAMADRNGFALAPHCDAARLVEAIQSHGDFKRLSLLERRQLTKDLTAKVAAPPTFVRYHIVRADALSARNEAVVYTLCDDEDGNEWKIRWWLVRSGAGWRFYDWLVFDDGLSVSRLYSLIIASANDPRLQKHVECFNAIEQSDQLLAQGLPEAAHEQLWRASSLPLPPLLSGRALLYTGYAWNRAGRYGEALQCYQRIGNAESVPGSLIGKAAAFQELGALRSALEHAEHYERVLGRDAFASRLRAEALMQLGRGEQALPSLRAALEFNPNQLDLLQSLISLVPDGAEQELVAHLKRAGDPVSAARQFAQTSAYQGHDASLAVVSRFLNEIAPSPATRSWLLALQCQAQGQLADAAGHYSLAAAAETDDDRRQEYLDGFFEAALAVGDPLAAYRAASDPRHAFRRLADAYESGENDFSSHTYAQLIEEHQQRDPNDPWPHYYRGLQQRQRDASEEALLAFSAGLALAEDEDTRSEFQQEIGRSLWLLGRVDEAYAALRDDEAGIGLLLGPIRWSFDAARQSDYERLLALRRADRPDDPWIDYYTALLALQQKQFDEAETALGAASRLESVDADALHRLKTDIRLAVGRIESLLDDAADVEEAFVDLARGFFYSDRWDELERLITHFRVRRPSSRQFLGFQAELLWHRQDFAALVALLDPWPVARSYQIDERTAQRLRNLLVRALLRLDRLGDAARAAEAAWRELAQVEPLILVHAAQGDLDGVERWLGELTPWRVDELYGDEDAAGWLRSEPFSRVRRQFPPYLEAVVPCSSVILLLDEPRPFSRDALEQQLAEVIGRDATFDQLSCPPTPARDACLICRRGSLQCTVTYGQTRWQCDGAPSDTLDPAVAAALEQHRGWLAIDVSDSSGSGSLTAAAPWARRVAAALAAADCLAVHLGDRGALLLPSENLWTELAAGSAPDSDAPEPACIWLTEAGAGDWSTDYRLRRTTARAVAAACRAEGDPPRLEVEVRIDHGAAVESCWLAVLGARRFSYGTFALVCRVIQDSHLASACKQGETVLVHESGILQSRPATGGAPAAP